MSRPPSWTPLDYEFLADCAVFRVGRQQTRSPRNDKIYDFYRLDAPDWVNVIPLTRENEIVMVAQYRQGAKKVVLETPGGMIDPGEEPAAAAAREMLEETGYVAETIEPLGSVNPNPALFGNQLHCFVARGARWKQPIQNTEREETVVELLPRTELPAKILTGEVDHALVLAAFHRLMLIEQSSE